MFLNLLPKLKSILRDSVGTPRFRDPIVDFQIAATDPLALEGAPQLRSMRGPFLSEHGSYLSLHLGGSTTDGVHAIMDRNSPNRLVFSYTQIMAGFDRFVPEPRTICMLGLGGGSLAKYCYDRFPESHILVAEISPEVIALRRHFFIPEDDTRFSVQQADGATLVQQHRDAFDVLLIDAFDEGGHLSHFNTRRFYRNCHRALTVSGVLVLNFSGDAWQRSFSRLERIFGENVVCYQCPDGDNVISFATKGKLPAFTR